jgi:hypothetical protein
MAMGFADRLMTAHAQDGPPMITDDPGTPGDGHWEINPRVHDRAPPRGAAELRVDSDAHVHATALTANIGVRIDLSEKCTLLVSVGRELHNAREARATLISYLGLQTRL